MKKKFGISGRVSFMTGICKVVCIAFLIMSFCDAGYAQLKSARTSGISDQKKKQNRELSIAIRKNDVKKVEEMIAQGGDLNRGLFYAVINNNVQIVEFMLSKGARPTYAQIFYANKKGFTKIKELLVAAKQKGLDGQTIPVPKRVDPGKSRTAEKVQDTKALEAEAARKKEKAAGTVARRAKFLASLQGVEKAAAEVIIRNLDKNREMVSNSIFGAFTSDIESEVVKITLVKEDFFGSTYTGYYILRVSGGLADLSHAMAAAMAGGNKAVADESKKQKIRIRVKYDGKKCIVDAFNIDGNGTNITFY